MRSQKYIPNRVSKHSKELNAAQRLGSKRNWANGVMLGGIIGALKYLKRVWPQLEVQRAIWAISQLQIDVDELWYQERERTAIELHVKSNASEENAGRNSAGM